MRAPLLLLLAPAAAEFYVISKNQAIQMGMAWAGGDEPFWTGGGRSGDPKIPGVGVGLLASWDNGTRWHLETPDVENPLTLAIAMAAAPSGTVCAAGLFSTWCANNTSSALQTKFERAQIGTPKGITGQFSDVKYQSGQFSVTGQFGSQRKWVNGLAVSGDGAETWTLVNATVTTPAQYAATPSATTWYLTAGHEPEEVDDEDDFQARAFLPPSLRRFKKFGGDAAWRSLTAGLNLSPLGDLPPPPTTYVGEVAKTTDAGETWTTVLKNDGAAGGQNFTFGDVHCADENTCLVAVLGSCAGPDDPNCDGGQPLALGSALWVTTDGGETWNETVRDEADPTNGFAAVRFTGDGREAFAASGGLYLSTSSSVHLWHSQDATDPTSWKMTSVHTDLAQLPLGMDFDPATKEVVLSVAQKDQVCGVLRGYADDVVPPAP